MQSRCVVGWTRIWVTSRIKYDGEGNKVLEIDPLGRETNTATMR